MSRRRTARRWRIGDRVWVRYEHQADYDGRRVYTGVITGYRGDRPMMGDSVIDPDLIEPIAHRGVWFRRWSHEQHRRTVAG